MVRNWPRSRRIEVMDWIRSSSSSSRDEAADAALNALPGTISSYSSTISHDIDKGTFPSPTNTSPFITPTSGALFVDASN